MKVRGDLPKSKMSAKAKLLVKEYVAVETHEWHKPQFPEVYQRFFGKRAWHNGVGAWSRHSSFMCPVGCRSLESSLFLLSFLSFLPPFHPPCLPCKSRLLSWGEVRRGMTAWRPSDYRGKGIHSPDIYPHLLNLHHGTFLCLLYLRNTHHGAGVRM